MANINLTVKSNFQDASSDIKNFGTLTETEMKRIEKALGKVKGQELDSFVQRNQRAAAAVKATRGPIASLSTEAAGLRRKIEALIRAGMDPMSDELKVLRTEYTKVNRQLEANTKAVEVNKKAYDGAKKATAGLAVAAVAMGAAFIKSASNIEDATAAFTPLLGGVEKAEELVGMLNKTAATTPFQFENISAAAKQLLPVMEGDLENTVETFRMLGDTAGGNAQKLESITRGYTKAMLKNKVDMEALNMIAEAGVPIYTELADSMGVSVEQLTQMSSAGEIASDDLTATFQKMTSEGGIFFEGMEIASATASGKLSTLKDVFVLLSAEIGSKLLPVWKNLLDGMISAGGAMISFVQDGEKMRKLLDVVLPIIGGVAAGLASFLVITKVIAIIKGLSSAMAVLNAVLAANPAILIAAAIAGVVAGIILLIRNWDSFVIFFQTTIAKISANFDRVSSSIKTGWTVAINTIKIAFLELGTTIFDKIMPAINTFLDLAGKLPFVGEKFQGLKANVNGLQSELNAAKDAAVENSRSMIESAKAENAAVQESVNARIAAINEEAEIRKAALSEQEAANAEFHAEQLANIQTREEEKTALLTETLAERLAVLNDLEAQQRIEDQETFTEFLNGRMEQEQVHGEERIAFLQEELIRISQLENLSGKERIAAAKQVNKMIAAEEKKQADFRKALLKAQLQDYANFFGSVGDLITAAGGKNREAAITAKVLAHAQAGINSALAFTAALAQAPWPLNLAAAGSVLAAGVAQQINIAKTPIPSAQTGTGPSGIVVPESAGTQRQDNVAVMAQPGETVNVTPRGETGGMTQNISVDLNGEALINFVNEKIESGDIRVTADNIQGGQTVA